MDAGLIGEYLIFLSKWKEVVCMGMGGDANLIEKLEMWRRC